MGGKREAVDDSNKECGVPTSSKKRKGMDGNKLMPKTKLAKVQELIHLKTEHHNRMLKEKLEQKIGICFKSFLNGKHVGECIIADPKRLDILEQFLVANDLDMDILEIDSHDP